MITDYAERDVLSSTSEINFKGRFIYYVVKDEVVIYIGQTTSLAARMINHKTSFNFDEFRVVEVDKSVCLDDIEFMQIIEHMPRYNLDLPTPSFLICKATILKMIERDIRACGYSDLEYDIDNPDFTFNIGSRTIKYWVDMGVDGYENNHAMLNRLIDELENN